MGSPSFAIASPLLSLAASTGDDDFFELVMYGVVFVALVLLLFLISKFLKFGIGRSIRDQNVPFAMSGEDLERLKKSGDLTEEEWRKVKASMAKKFLERAKAEEQARSQPANAEVILAATEAQVRGVPPSATSTPPIPVRGELPGKRTEPPAPAAPAAPPLPEELVPLLGKSDLELEELIMAGFLTQESAQKIREARQ